MADWLEPRVARGLPHGWLDQLRLHLQSFSRDQLDRLVDVWTQVYPAYEYLIRQNIADGNRVIYRVHFAASDATLRDSMKPVLEQVVRLLDEKPELNLQIDGFYDDSCSYEESFKLSDSRVAAAVSDYLCSRGITS